MQSSGVLGAGHVMHHHLDRGEDDVGCASQEEKVQPKINGSTVFMVGMLTNYYVDHRPFLPLPNMRLWMTDFLG